MMPQFKNMNDLMEYLGQLEHRVALLEDENRNFRSMMVDQSSLESKNISRYIPKTNLFSKNFLFRAFTVWGHMFVAQLIIGIAAGMLYFCIVMVLLRSLLGNTLGSGQ